MFRACLTCFKQCVPTWFFSKVEAEIMATFLVFQLICRPKPGLEKQCFVICFFILDVEPPKVHA